MCEAFGSRPITIQWLRRDASDSQLTPLAIPMIGTTQFDSPSSTSSSTSSAKQSQQASLATKFNPFSSSQPAYQEPRRSDGREDASEDRLSSSSSSSSRLTAFQTDIAAPDERTSFELHIQSTRLTDSALYACKISNEFGDDSSSMELTVLGNRLAIAFLFPSLALLPSVSVCFASLCA